LLRVEAANGTIDASIDGLRQINRAISAWPRTFQTMQIDRDFHVD
jgi:hypothetical protein